MLITEIILSFLDWCQYWGGSYSRHSPEGTTTLYRLWPLQSSTIYCRKTEAVNQEKAYSSFTAKSMVSNILWDVCLSCGSINNFFFLKHGFFFPLSQEAPEEGWHDLVAKGFIEYIDTEEEETTMISMTINVSFSLLCNFFFPFSSPRMWCR